MDYDTEQQVNRIIYDLQNVLWTKYALTGAIKEIVIDPKVIHLFNDELNTPMGTVKFTAATE